jgi:hypothetical protein
MKRARRAAMIVAAVAVAALVFVWFENSISTPDIRAFDPREMGRLESAMWRSYYEGEWVRLGLQAMEVAHRQYGFSWWDSLRMAAHAARAALYFRKSTDDPRCLPVLESYYAIICKAVARKFDIPAAARLELEWWKERRRNVAPRDYAGTIAKLTALIYGVSEEAVLPSATLRAEAMAYRDARRDGKMTEADWHELSGQLETAYAGLREAVGH